MNLSRLYKTEMSGVGLATCYLLWNKLGRISKRVINYRKEMKVITKEIKIRNFITLQSRYFQTNWTLLRGLLENYCCGSLLHQNTKHNERENKSKNYHLIPKHWRKVWILSRLCKTEISGVGLTTCCLLWDKLGRISKRAINYKKKKRK